MSTAVRSGTGDLYQLPTIALVCNFEETSQDPNLPPSLLSQHDVETLFHEMGHAIHSVLGATDLQTICGTRCATDFAELPSVLMESFATSPQVLSLYARHWKTDVPLPEEMMHNLALHREDRHSIHGGIDNETQIIMALLDQMYYSVVSGHGPIDTTAIFRQVAAAHSSLPDPPHAQTTWQGFFSHLYMYGATYYSYLFDRAIAHKVWSDVFTAGERALDRDAGEKFKGEVLRWGGGRDGCRCAG
jgi:intermediate peptidase